MGSIGTCGRTRSTTAGMCLDLKVRPRRGGGELSRSPTRMIFPFFQTQASALYGPTRRGSVHVWIDNSGALTAAAICAGPLSPVMMNRSEEHTSELQSHSFISYA